MQLRIVLVQFWRDLKAQRLRTALTLFGLAWGTFCVVVLLSFGEGLSRKQMNTMQGLGTRIILLWGSRTSVAHEGLPRGRYIRLEDADADRIAREVPGVTQASPEYSRGVMLTGPGGQAAANLSAVRPGFGAMRRIEPEPGGRFLNERDETERRRVCVLGSRVRKEAFGDRARDRSEPRDLGDPVHRDRHPAREGTGQQLQRSGRRTRSSFQRPSPSRPSAIAIRTTSWSKSPRGSRAPTSSRGSTRRSVAPTISIQPTRRRCSTWDVGEMIAMISTVFIGFRVFLGLIGVLTLAVAGIGVANMMSMVVEDRTSQIGISMALGARHSWVLGQVLLETLLVTAAGGLIGVTLAGAIVVGCQFLPLENSIGDPVFSGQIAALTAGILGLIGIAAGVGPARRAAYLNPAEALRSR